MTSQNQDEPGDIHGQNTNGDTAPASPVKRTFVEPVISHPVDVLEATTFFQAVDSGGTGLLPRRQQGAEPSDR
jgi:hypothetical protein